MQGGVKGLGGSPLGLLPLPGPPALPFSSSLASLELHQTSLRQTLHLSYRGPLGPLGDLGIPQGVTYDGLA